MEIKQEIQLPKLHNFFEIKVIDTITREVVQEARAENIVLDQLYNRLAAGAKLYRGLNTIGYGKGTGEISASRTALFQGIGSKSALTNKAIVSQSADLVEITTKITIPENEIVGEYIREIGAFANDRSGYADFLMTHALLEDSEGNPISIGPKTALQIIEIYYTLYIQRGAGMVPFPNLFSKIWTDEYSPNENLLSPYIAPHNIALAGGTYNPATKTYTSGVTSLSASTGNAIGAITGIKSDLLANNVTFPDLSVFPEYTFLERQIGSGDGANKLFSFNMGLFKAGSEVVKVNGVAQTRGVDYIPHQGASNLLMHSKSQDLPYGGLTAKVYATNDNKDKLGLLATLPADAFPQIQKLMLDYEQEIWLTSLATTQNDLFYGKTAYSSLDGVTWSLIKSIPNGGGNGSIQLTPTAPVKCRYVWAAINYITFASFDTIRTVNVEFVNPPPVGAIVSASWVADVPPKTDKILYDIQAAYTFSW